MLQSNEISTSFQIKMFKEETDLSMLGNSPVSEFGSVNTEFEGL